MQKYNWHKHSYNWYKHDDAKYALYYDSEHYSTCLGPVNREKLIDAYLFEYTANIGEKAFYNCTKLKNIQGAKRLYELGAEALKDCKSLNRVELNVIDIGESAFENSGCEDGIRFFLAHTNVVQQRAFKNTKIKDLHLSTKIFGDEAFMNAVFEDPIFYVPYGTEEMGNRVFKGTNLTDIYLRDSLETVGDLFSDEYDFKIHMSNALFEKLEPDVSNRIVVNGKIISVDDLIDKYTFKGLNNKRLQKESQIKNQEENNIDK